jgi:Mn2+/Fe2+ NRAMP family transporter
MGRVTGCGIAGNMRRFYPAWMLYVIIAFLVIANIINLGADIGAMGAALNLLIGGPALLYCVLFTLVSVILEIRIPYQTYSGILKWMTLSLFTYVGTIFVVQINWLEVIRGTFVPTISFKGEYLAALIAVLGTTISPYLLFWQAGEEVEQMESEPKENPLKKAPPTSTGTTSADQNRYLCRNGVFQPYCLLHHFDCGSDTSYAWENGD